jgi:aspartate-semialdehyde dehydrogenase
MKIAVVGATGMVGQVMRVVLAELNFPVTELIPVASERSVGKEIEFKGKKHIVVGMEEAISLKPDIALFSAGGETSKIWAPKFAEAGTTVIDNSSAWRMDGSKKLIVPEINPLHKKYGIKRVVISTYQSITGTGAKAVLQLENERQGIQGEMAYPYPIDGNCLPHCDDFTENGYTKEEMKLVNETKKILGDDSVKVTATAVRVPVQGGHSEAVNIEFENDFDLAELRKILSQSEGVTLQDNPDTNTYPMPRYAEGKNDTFVGRIRRDETQENTLNLWIVADNLRKGAAANTVQIAQYLVDKGLV